MAVLKSTYLSANIIGRSPFLCAIAALLLALLPPQFATAERIKDIASVAGVRDNPLLGYGLVVGLDGTGDKTGQVAFTEQSLRTMLLQFGITVPPETTINPKNVAAVTVHAVIPPFSKPGQKIDITASSLGNAVSLRGGTLLMTPLRGADGEVYAVAQGNIIVNGVSAAGEDGTNVTVNIPSVGRIPGGATIERSVKNDFLAADTIMLNLHSPDFTTALRVAEAINVSLKSNFAQALDAVSVVVKAPADSASRVGFLSHLELLEVVPETARAQVIINARTGTIVIGNHVTVMPAAVSHGGITVTIKENINVDQPNPLAAGETAVTPETEVDVDTGGVTNLITLDRGVTLQEVVKALNRVGASTNDLISILEALKTVGALRAQLIVI